MKNTSMLATVACVAFSLPVVAFADDKQLEKRLEALEAKMERMAAIEAENKELKVRLQKTEAKLEKVSSQKLATVSPVRTLERQATPVTLATPVIAKETPVAPVSTESNWSGVYAGINAGYGTNNISRSTNSFSSEPFLSFPVSIVTFGMTSDSFVAEGPVVGGQIGYNYRLPNHLLIGAELDMDFADINNRHEGRYSSSSYMASNSQVSIASGNTTWTLVGGNYAGSSNQYNRYGLNWVGTARARIGYAFDKFLPFLTAGLAYGELSHQTQTSDTQARYYQDQVFSVIENGTRYSQTSANGKNISLGWAAGAGAEYMVTDNISGKLEYLFTQLGGMNTYTVLSTCTVTGACYPLSGSSTTHINNFGIHQVRVGLNYHTDWLKNFSVNTEQR